MNYVKMEGGREGALGHWTHLFTRNVMILKYIRFYKSNTGEMEYGKLRRL